MLVGGGCHGIKTLSEGQKMAGWVSESQLERDAELSNNTESIYARFGCLFKVQYRGSASNGHPPRIRRLGWSRLADQVRRLPTCTVALPLMASSLVSSRRRLPPRRPPSMFLIDFTSLNPALVASVLGVFRAETLLTRSYIVAYSVGTSESETASFADWSNRHPPLLV